FDNAFIISFLNAQLVYGEFNKWMANSQSYSLNIALVGLEIGLLILLMLTFLIPIFIKRNQENQKEIHEPFEAFTLEEISKQHFQRIIIALDFSKTDKKVINYATQLASTESSLILVHVVESATVKYTGEKTNDAEALSDLKRLEQYAQILRPIFNETKIELGYNNRVNTIVEISKRHNADLIIVGSHGHRGFMDFIFGETINKLRHRVDIPVFIAK
ncbi:MAG: universal stress protein, partial [Algoriella sp.]